MVVVKHIFKLNEMNGYDQHIWPLPYWVFSQKIITVVCLFQGAYMKIMLLKRKICHFMHFYIKN